MGDKTTINFCRKRKERTQNGIKQMKVGARMIVFKDSVDFLFIKK